MKKQKLSLSKLQLKKDIVIGNLEAVRGGDGATALTVCARGQSMCLDDTCGSTNNPGMGTFAYSCPAGCGPTANTNTHRTDQCGGCTIYEP